MLDAWVAGEPVEASAEATQLQQRLLGAGLLHPILEPVQRHDVGFVVPVYDDTTGLAETLAAIRVDFPDAPVVVVDDCSVDPVAYNDIADSHGASLIRHAVNQGPGAARNTGWRALTDDVAVIVFVDSDVVPVPGCIALLLAHFEEPAITAMAPRIRAAAGQFTLDRYEAMESPLDLGDAPAVVRPGSSVPYVPSTVLAVRRAALEANNGFDEAMRVGEDVDFIWRLLDDGAAIRYEPRAEAIHRNRPTWSALARQRHGYGTAAASLDQRHPGDVAPIELPTQTLLAWSLAWLGGLPGVAAGLALAGYDAYGLRSRLGDRVDEPTSETLRLSGMGHAHAGFWLARAMTRAWLPIALLVAPSSARARAALIASLVVPNAVTWVRERPAMNPLSYLAARFLDDAAYCSGVWRGAFEARSLRVLMPRLAKRPTKTGS